MRPVQRSRYRALQWFLLMAVGAISHSAIAQPRQRSHRVLELPQSGMSDLQQQLQMLSQLQSLVGRQEQETTEGSGIDSEQLSQLQQMIKQFGGDLPQEMLPLLNSVPPNVIRETLADPKARQQIQQLLQQYARDNQLPRGGPGAVMPLLPPAEGNRSPNRSNQNSSSASGTSQPSPNSDSNADPSDGPLKKMLEEMLKRFSDSAEDPLSADAQPEPLPDQRPADDDDSQNPWSDVLDRLITEERKLREGDGSNAAATDNKRFGTARSANKQSDVTDEETEANSQSKTVADYLRELQNQPSPPVQRQPPNMRQTRPSASEPSISAGRQPSIPEESATTREQLKKETKSSLQRSGITETLRKIARDARQQVRTSGDNVEDTSNESRSGAQSGGFSGLERSLIRTLDGLRKDIVEIAKDAKFKPSRSAAERPTSEPTNSRSGSGLRSIGRSTGDFLNNLASTPASSPGSSQATPVGINEVVSENIFGGLTLLLLVVVVAVYAWRSGLLAPPFREPVRVVPMRATDIQTKEDVVVAFHKMALQPSRQAQRWWTHRKVADQIFQDRPEHVHAVRILTARVSSACSWLSLNFFRSLLLGGRSLCYLRFIVRVAE
ncbi:MAG: hypothetical protein GY826_11275, partial [Fuerstiella sp.]|nr:hypothetical protein [Fuerstiella sp.]